MQPRCFEFFIIPNKSYIKVIASYQLNCFFILTSNETLFSDEICDDVLDVLLKPH